MDWIITHIPPWFWIALVVFGVILGTVAYLILLERKVASWVQDRIGPNRVGPFGLLQPMADGLKMFVKEDYRPGGVDRILFTVAPAIMMIVVIVSLAVIPWGGTMQQTTAVSSCFGPPPSKASEVIPPGTTLVSVEQAPHATLLLITYRYPFQIASLNIGVLFIIAVLSMSVYGVVIGGWASNNKYSFLGGLRATANMLSYEIPLGLAVLTIVILYGTLDLQDIVAKQAHYWGGVVPAWNIFTQPLAFLIFLICIHAEANRLPFDLAEAEQELVGGYHTEYSSMRLSFFFLAEYTGMLVTSSVCVALFFGGWHLPWLEWLWPALAGNVDRANPSITTSLLACLVRSAVFFTKVLAIIFVFMWVRWSLPRFRFDQLMLLAWRALIPMSLAMLLATALTLFIARPIRPDLMVNGRLALMLLGANIVVVLLSLVVSALLPHAPQTNRRVRVIGSRFSKEPVAT